MDGTRVVRGTSKLCVHVRRAFTNLARRCHCRIIGHLRPPPFNAKCFDPRTLRLHVSIATQDDRSQARQVVEKYTKERTPSSQPRVSDPTDASHPGRRVDRVSHPVGMQPQPPIRPASDGWLLNPSWVDGGVDPPQFYHSQEEIIATRCAHWERYNALHAQHEANNAAEQHAAAAAPQQHGPHNRPQPAMQPLAQQRPQTVQHPNQQCQTVPPPTQRQETAPPPIQRQEMAPPPTQQRQAVPASTRPRRATTPPSTQNETSTYEGHFVTVILQKSITEKVVQRGVSKSVEKLMPIPKIKTIPLIGITRVEFVKAFLSAHGIGDHFNASPVQGPCFRMWWTGLNKGAAGNIETNEDFATALADILKRRKPTVSVEIDVKVLEPYRIKAQTLSDADVTELVHGTQVPQLNSFSDEEQLHGHIVMKIKQAHKCPEHLGEHGELGHCYRNGDVHVGLNPRRLKSWAASIAAYKSTVDTPPNIVLFDGPQDGSTIVTKPRGRTGPRPVQELVSATSGEGGGHLIPVLTTLAATHLANVLSQAASATPSVSIPGSSRRRSTSPHPRRRASSSSHRRSSPPRSSPPASPTLRPANRLHDCLIAFRDQTGIDLSGCETALRDLDFTPDILADVAITRLHETTGAVEGQLMKLQKFAKGWNRREDKKRAHA